MSTKLYVGNLPEDTKEKELKDIFQSFGDVTDVAVLRGYGFVVSTDIFSLTSRQHTFIILFLPSPLPAF